ncbi:MAG: hypothetical protein FJ398_10965 [Verrucomicrobia bacterium]|nr:hypothetical protein [Verrucomicrobiota bacterium]
MVASLLTGQPDMETFAELLRPDPLPDGTEPEERLILCGLSWERYLALDIALIERCVAIRSWQKTRQAFRNGLVASR